VMHQPLTASAAINLNNSLREHYVTGVLRK
jgi:hypothetical protein